jgi:hypothetical protein
VLCALYVGYKQLLRKFITKERFKFYEKIMTLTGESNGKLPLRTCLECSVPEPYRSPDWALVPAKNRPKGRILIIIIIMTLIVSRAHPGGLVVKL